MPDTKDDGSSEEMQGMTPLSGGGYVPRREPARADFTKWARRDIWHIAEAVMLLLGFEPFDVNAHSWPKGIEGFDNTYETASRSISAGTLRATPKHYVRPRDFLAWAREKEYPIPEELEAAVNRFQPIMAVAQKPPATKDGKIGEPAQERDTSRERVAKVERAVREVPVKGEPTGWGTTTAPDNEPTARRKAPDTFIAALIRLIAEISKRAAEKGMPFNVTEMPGTKADFRALAIKFDDKLDKAGRTFDDYLAGLVRFKQGARETTYYQELFPEFFRS